MQVAIIAIGSELLGPIRLDTNSLFLTERFEGLGVKLIGKSVVGDDVQGLVDILRFYVKRCDLVVLTGGLGPTADDITRGAVAQACERQVTIDEDVVDDLRRRFASFGLKMPEVNRRQGEVIEGARLLSNAKGSAPGQQLRQAECEIFLFPGVPREMRAMSEDHLFPWLREQLDEDRGVERRELKVACLAESEVEKRISPAYEEFGREVIVVLASPGEVTLQAVAHGSASERTARLDAMEARLRELAGDAVFTQQEGDSLEALVGRELAARGATLATAESCTGGLVAERLTRVPGSSVFFEGGAVTYSNALKQAMLGVREDDLMAHGAVSEVVGRQMAEGVRQRLGSDYGIGITGIAGPGGGSDEKPVGTVHVAVAGPDGTEHRHLRLPGGRQQVRQQTAQWVLDMTRRMLQGLAPAAARATPGPSSSESSG